MAARRLKERKLRSEPIKLRGMHPGDPSKRPCGENLEVGQRVLWIGRLIPEKRATLVPSVISTLHEEFPLLRGLLIGAGPEADLVNKTILELGVSDLLTAPGFVERDAVVDAFATADCLLVTSLREGYGVVVLEAAAYGTPVVVVEAEDNAASELIVPGVNGYLVDSSHPKDIARMISRVIHDGPRLRATTRKWFEDNASSLQSSEIVRRTYETIP
jgi:glycosyltransferase involved in cell wall biosynthesis